MIGFSSKSLCCLIYVRVLLPLKVIFLFFLFLSLSFFVFFKENTPNCKIYSPKSMTTTTRTHDKDDDKDEVDDAVVVHGDGDGC